MAFLSLFGKKKNPAQAAMPYLQQIPGMATQQLNPYIQQGQTAGTAALGTYGQMAQDPADFVNQLMAGYTPSKGFQFKKNEALQAMQNSANAGGFAGTRQDQLQQGELADALASQDMYNWLSQVLGVQGTGLAGQQGFANQGFEANKSLTDILGSVLGSQAGLAFQGQSQSNKNMMDLISILGQLGGAAIGSFGGPAGTAAGAQIGGQFANSIW